MNMPKIKKLKIYIAQRIVIEQLRYIHPWFKDEYDFEMKTITYYSVKNTLICLDIYPIYFCNDIAKFVHWSSCFGREDERMVSSACE